MLEFDQKEMRNFHIENDDEFLCYTVEIKSKIQL